VFYVFYCDSVAKNRNVRSQWLFDFFALFSFLCCPFVRSCKAKNSYVTVVAFLAFPLLQFLVFPCSSDAEEAEEAEEKAILGVLPFVERIGRIATILS
jgi:hypothetical protein